MTGAPVLGPGPVARRLDSFAWWLLAAFAAWIVVAATVNGASPLPMLGTLLLAAGGVVVARGITVRGRPVGAALVAGLGVAAVVLSLGGLTGAAGAPLLYGNANAALFLQATAAALLLAAGWGSWAGRVGGLAAAALFATMVVLTGSRAGIILLLALAVAAAASSLGSRGVRAVTAIGAAGVIAAVVVTLLVAAGGIGRAAREDLADRVSSSRIRLWAEAWSVMEERPAFGIGPGAFALGSRTARTDRDIGWAHHDFLQQGAETGAPGFLFLGFAFLWGFARLGAAPPDAPTGVAASALAVLGIHASTDYVLHFPAVVLAAAAVLGTATAARDRRPDEARPGTLVRKALKASLLPLGTGRTLRRGDVPILLYHRVGRGGREVDLDADAFERQVAAVAARGDVVSLERALSDGGGVVLSFDDGYRDFHERALPALSRHRIPVTLYLATGLVVDEGGPPDGLTWDHLREAVATGLVTVGSHTHGHANLARASERETEDELRRSQELIEDRLGVACRHFAYPWGVGSPLADRAVRRRFDSAALAWGTNRAGRIDVYRLARLPILRSDGPALFRAKVEGRLDGEAMLYRLLGRGPWRRR